MNWEIINNERSLLKEFRLVDNNDCKMVIKYSPLHHSARITCGNHHRLFFFENAGSLGGKTLFKNEYGMEIGNLGHDKFHPKNGLLTIDGIKYLYHLENDVLPEVVIYDCDEQNALANCGIPFSSNLEAIDNNCYLLGLCWYLFLLHPEERTAQYAIA